MADDNGEKRPRHTWLEVVDGGASPSQDAKTENREIEMEVLLRAATKVVTSTAVGKEILFVPSDTTSGALTEGEVTSDQGTEPHRP